MAIVVMILQGIGILIGVFVLYLVVVALIPGFAVPEQHLEKAKQPTREPNTEPSCSRKDVSFEVKGTSISAWLVSA
jgi:hypothetical protein